MEINLSILIVGAGSIGSRHLANLQTLTAGPFAVCDPDSEAIDSLQLKPDIFAFRDFPDALRSFNPDVVVLCTPPHLHVIQALAAVRAGAHVFIEKPLSHSLEEVDLLVSEAVSRDRLVQVGYNLRFHPGLKNVKEMLDNGKIGKVLCVRSEFGQYLPDWRPWQDYRDGYSAQRSMGGGIIFDSSHEIDYLRWLFGEINHIYCWAGTISDLEVDVEDTALMVLRFESGVVGEVHLDFIQRARVRNCKIVGDIGTLIWDYVDDSVMVYTASTGQWTRSQIQFEPNDMYLEEMKSFLTDLQAKQWTQESLIFGAASP